ncbi:terminal uridylyltransferase 7-like isoform X2 [Narcine bancroftii]|uniref:terminal uridylyltransferase 7-like isoform X2 n=1 Tax=Narcine bancroftii TaxID=1343680 RepID=UPI0038311ADE
MEEKSNFPKRNRELVVGKEETNWKSIVHQENNFAPGSHAKKFNTRTEIQKQRDVQENIGPNAKKGAQVISNANTVARAGYSLGSRSKDGRKEKNKKWTSGMERGSLIQKKERKWKENASELRYKFLPKDVEYSKTDWSRPSNDKVRNARRQLHKEYVNDELFGKQTEGPKKSKKMKRNEQMQDSRALVVDESKLIKEERLRLHLAEERLKEDFIFRFRKDWKNLGLPSAPVCTLSFFFRSRRKRPRSCPTEKYSCKLCDVLIESVSSAYRHIRERKHRKCLKDIQEEGMLAMLPPPSPSQVGAIGAAINKIVREDGLTEDDVKIRHEITRKMEDVLQYLLQGCSLRLYGSSCTGFGFKDSDLNIDIQFPPHMNQPDVLLLVQESLKNSISFIDVEAEFHARVPVILCKDKQSGLLCKVSAGNENAWLTTCHLTALAKLEPSLTPLVIAFRSWGKLCHVDCPEEGGLPPYAFALMVIFFLQQRSESVLPVYLGIWIEGFLVDDLAKFSLKGVENNEVTWEYKWSEDDSFEGKVPLVFETNQRSSVPVGQLWVELLRFYAIEFSLTYFVINIRIRELLSREAKDWPKRRIAVEDPYSVKRNVARTLSSQIVFDYLIHCLRATYKYFALPRYKSAKFNKRNNEKADSKSASSAVADQKELFDFDTSGVSERTLISSAECQQFHDDATINNVEKLSSENSDRNLETLQDCGSESFTEEELITDLQKFEITADDLSEDDENQPESEDKDDEHLESGDAEELFNMFGLQKDNATIAGRILSEGTFPQSIADNETSSDDEMSSCVNHMNCYRDHFNSESLSDSEIFLNPQNIGDGVEVEDSNQLDMKDEEITSSEVRESSDSTDELHCCSKKATQHQERNEEDDVDFDEFDLNRVHLDSLTAEEDFLNTSTGSSEEDNQSDENEIIDDELHNWKECSLEIPSDVTLQTIKHAPSKKQKQVQNEIKKEISVDETDSTLIGCEFQRSDDSVYYVFSKAAFTKGKASIIVCSLCKREGHLKHDCPEDFKKYELDPLPQMTPKFLEELNKVCIQCFCDFSPDRLEIQAREHIMVNLQAFIRRELDAKAKLCLFGSSKNGFGFRQSDLDICMTFEDRETAEGLNCIKIIEDLARVLRKNPALKNILPITTAKVPIVKFFHVRSGLEGDISLYNTLALHNTGLLACYAAIDPRVKYIGYTMKVFAKVCDIGDASRGSLSSYAYTLMALYFLQQRKPPVIPVLQEITCGIKKPEHFVDGWNVYYFDKLDELKNKWPDYGKNKETLGELWLGLLRFYTEEFDFKEHVISIRRKTLLTTFKKQWTSKYIVIEDPFDLNHNLGAGLSRKMTHFIIKAFINGRKVFGTPIKCIPVQYPTIMEYFFDPEILTEGKGAPNDRCCRICGKIGHFMKDCPMRKGKARQRQHVDDFQKQLIPVGKCEKLLEKVKRIVEKDSPKKMPKPHHQGLKDAPVKGETYSEVRIPRKSKEAKPANEMFKAKVARQYYEQRKKQEERDKRCFICGKEGHIKKECPLHTGEKGTEFTASAFSSVPSIGNENTKGNVKKKKQKGYSQSGLGGQVSTNPTLESSQDAIRMNIKAAEKN